MADEKDKKSGKAADPKKKQAGRKRWEGVSEKKKKSLMSQAAHARWRQPNANVKVADFQGVIDLAGITLNCAVLNDKTRVLSERSISGALGHQRVHADYYRKQDAAASGQEILPAFISLAAAPFLSKEARDKLTHPIRYQVMKGFGIPAVGIEATLLADICEAYLAAQDAGALPPEDLGKAAAAGKLVRALARVGLVALIDEATGYQVVRDRDELQKLLAQYVSAEYQPWSQKFPDEYYIELFRLRGLKTADIRRRPLYFGKITNDIVYSRLLPGMLPKLDEVNPANDEGRRARKHHQHLLDQGEEHLTKHLMGCVFLMRASTNWDDFKRALDRASPVQDAKYALRKRGKGDSSDAEETA